jgi:hypothetical protein
MRSSCVLGIVAGLAGAASAQIAPVADLTAGTLRNGTTRGRSVISDAPNWAFFTLNAVAGDHIDIEVNRVDGGLDPGSSVVFGDATGLAFSSLTGTNFDTWSGPGLSAVLARGDDDDPPAVAGPFGDPHYQFTAGSTGTYTVAVCGVSSASQTTTYRFQVIARGSTWGGACCLGDGTCVQASSASDCQALNGVYRGDLVPCTSGHCPCNVLTNGGFETGSFSGWTQFGATDHTDVTGVAAHTGLFGGRFGPVEHTGGIQQVVPAAAGAPLVIDFWYSSFDSPQSFSVDLGGVTLVSFVDDQEHVTPTEFTIPVLAPTANPVLRFTCRNDPDFIFLDDIRVCVGAGSSASCYANCDNSTTTPVLNILDFACFLNRFTAGCS